MFTDYLDQINGVAAKKAKVAEFDNAMQARLKGMQSSLDSATPPKELAMEAMGKERAANPQFEMMRQRATQQATANQQMNNDSIRRRFASLGALNSGAAIKTQQQADDVAGQQRQEAIEGVNAQEAAQNQALDESARGRNLTREMSNADRAFQDKVFRFDSGSKLAQLDMAFDEHKTNRETNAANLELQKQQAANSGGFFGGGGFLGLGI